MSTSMSPVETAFPAATRSNAAAFADAGRRFNIAVRSLRHAAAVATGVAFLGVALPATAASARDGLTSHLPWLAPVGHRQPRQADIPQDEILSAWEREQQRLDDELDRKLSICRGC
jgi:hypothetical protein